MKGHFRVENIFHIYVLQKLKLRYAFKKTHLERNLICKHCLEFKVKHLCALRFVLVLLQHIKCHFVIQK